MTIIAYLGITSRNIGKLADGKIFILIEGVLNFSKDLSSSYF